MNSLWTWTPYNNIRCIVKRFRVPEVSSPSYYIHILNESAESRGYCCNITIFLWRSMAGSSQFIKTPSLQVKCSLHRDNITVITKENMLSALILGTILKKIWIRNICLFIMYLLILVIPSVNNTNTTLPLYLTYTHDYDSAHTYEHMC